MQQFTIKDVENLLGIKAHTLRVWEQRYAFFAPKRKESAHRYYDNEDLKLLLQVSFLYHQGWKISRIAALDHSKLEAEVAAIPLNQNTYPHFVVQLIAQALEFDEQGFGQLLDNLTAEIGFERTVLEVCFPFLQRVGLLWVTNHLVPAQEHFSSYLIQYRIISATEKLSMPQHAPELILFAPRGEFHELPLLFLHYLFRKNGWSVLFLGKNVALEVLESFKDNVHIRFLYLHLLTNLMQLDPETYLEQLVRTFPGLQIVASGIGIQGIQRNFQNVRLLRSDKEILEFVKDGKKEERLTK